MAIGQKALSYLPKMLIALNDGTSYSIESFKGVLYTIAEMQKQEAPNSAYFDIKASRRNPFINSVWNILKGDFADASILIVTPLAADTVTVNALIYTAVAGVKADNTEFSIDGTNLDTSIDLADSITNDTRSGTLNDVIAIEDGDTVLLFQTVAGPGGNATTLATSNGSRLVPSGATFTGGSNDDVFRLFFVSQEDTNSKSGIANIMALSSGRDVSITVQNNGNQYTVRSILGVVSFIQNLELKVAQTGSEVSTDGTYIDTIVTAVLPFETFQWTIIKLANAYSIIPTVNS